MLDLPQVASFPTTKNLSAHIKVRKEILTFVKDVDTEKVLASNKITFSDKKL